MHYFDQNDTSGEYPNLTNVHRQGVNRFLKGMIIGGIAVLIGFLAGLMILMLF